MLKKHNKDSAQSHFSNTLPPVWNVPAHCNIYFTGREAIFSKLAEEFHFKKKVVPPQVIKGMAGIGKTQIAVEYAFRYESIYDAIWWIRANDKKTLSSDYTAFAAAMNLMEQPAQDENAVIDAVRDWLTGNQNWLLIFDDVMKPEDLKPYLPEKSGGHVIITTRHMVWKKSFCELPLLFWSQSESVDFLLRRTNNDDPQGAADVAEQLGNLPLAMELAGAYMVETEIGFGDYLQSYTTCQNAITKTSPNYSRTVGTAFRLSLQTLQNGAPAFLRILYLSALLASDGISRRLISTAGRFAASPFAKRFNDPKFLENGIAVLEQYGLVTSISEDLFVNRLVQVIVREHMTADERQIWVEAAVRTIHHIFSSEEENDGRPKPQWDNLLCHARAAIVQAGENGVALEPVADLLVSIRTHMQRKGAFAEAETYFIQALDLCERTFGDDHPYAGAVANNLASLLRDLGRLDEAESYFRRALHIYQTRLGEGHLYTGVVANDLASLLRDRGENEEAARLFLQTLKVITHWLGKDHLYVGAAINNLAVVLFELGRFEQAEPLFQKAIRTWENKLGENHLHIATGLLNLSVLLEYLGRHAEAEPYIRRAIKIRKTHSENEDLLVAESLLDLVRVLKKQGKYDAAESLCRRAVKIVEVWLGTDHPGIAGALFDLAVLLQDQGKFLEAEPLYLQVLLFYESKPGADHLDTALVLNNLSQLYHGLGRFSESERHCRRALEILNGTLGAKHPDTKTSRRNLSAILQSMGKLQEAASPKDK